MLDIGLNFAYLISPITSEASFKSFPPHPPYQRERLPASRVARNFNHHTRSRVCSENSFELAILRLHPSWNSEVDQTPDTKSRIGDCGTGLYRDICQVCQGAIRILLPGVVRSATWRQIENVGFEGIQISLLSTFQYKDPTYPLYAYKQKIK